MLAEKPHVQGTCGRRELKDLLDDKSKSMVQSKAGEERMVRKQRLPGGDGTTVKQQDRILKSRL